MGEDGEPDRRSPAEKRIDARREARGLPTDRPAVRPGQRLGWALVLFVLGALMLSGSVPILGLLAWAGGLYFLIAGAIQRGIQDSRDSDDRQ